MVKFLFFIFAVVLIGCSTNQQQKNHTDKSSNHNDTTLRSDNPSSADHQHNTDKGTHHSHDNDAVEGSSDQNIATYFVVVADTGKNYYTLHKKMFELNKQFRIPIDTMERSYNEKKNLIALSENDDDELYAGEYFPRRFPSTHLSLEYLNVYQKEAGKKTIALVTGIYEKQKSADSALNILHTAEKKGFKVKAEIFVGCAH